MSQSWRIGEKEYEYLANVLKNGFPGSTKVSYVKKLEELFSGKFEREYGVTFANGTATLHAALWAAGVRAGDEVIVPPLTMASTSYAVLYLNAIPVYADIDPDTFLISPASIRERITIRTKAVIPVSLYGLSPDMDVIMEIAAKYGLAVIEDNAQCFLGKYKGKVVGSMGHIASYSFQNSKHMTCGEGGITITSDRKMAENMRRFSSLGYSLIGAEAGASKIEKNKLVSPDFVRHVDLGFNYRMSELCAAVAYAQLEKLDNLVVQRQKCAAGYQQITAGCDWLIPQTVPAFCEHSYWAFTLRLDTEQTDFSWRDFYNKFIEFGGEGFYGAWCLTYQEPFFKAILPDCSCPIAEKIQPQLIQLKTNYGKADEFKKQIEIFAKTVDFFEN